uniref:Uncharacterized protein n=1 Tax=Anguilla anguilla TaxID=7936 RepID=A0A0E9U948_ANGAN
MKGLACPQPKCQVSASYPDGVSCQVLRIPRQYGATVVLGRAYDPSVLKIPFLWV